MPNPWTSAPLTPVEATLAVATLDSLLETLEEARGRILKLRDTLREYFVGRDEAIDNALLCAAAGEPLLFVGPPGTGKSDLILKLVDALQIPEGRYFEYMLTKFSEPSEILGPIDIELLKQGRFLRRTQGKLPEAEVVFLDEIFKSNSAILNTLLTILNERKFYQDGQPVPVPLRVFFAATNELPEHSELDALSDRFVLKTLLRPVKDTHFTELIDAGLSNEVYRAMNDRPWVRGDATVEDLVVFRTCMDRILSLGRSPSGRNLERDRDRWFPGPVFAEWRRLLRTLEVEYKIHISDRKVIKLYRLLRSRAALFHGGPVRHSDLSLLAHIGNRRHELESVQDCVRRLLGLSSTP